MIISIPFKVYKKIRVKSMKSALDDFINHDVPEVFYNNKHIGLVKSADYMKCSKECILLNIELDDGCYINNVKEMMDDVKGHVECLQANIYYIASIRGDYFIPYKIKTIQLNSNYDEEKINERCEFLNNLSKLPAFATTGDDKNNGV